MTLASKLAFTHELKELVDKYRINIVDNYEGLVFSSIDDDGHIWPEVVDDGEWEVQLSFGWQINDFVVDKVLAGKVEIVPGQQAPSGVLAFPRTTGVVLYLIDSDGNGSWLIRASAYEKSSLAEPRPELVTKDFPIDDKLFYELLAKAEAAAGK